MLSKLQTQPFQYIISNLKKIVQQQQIKKQQDQIKRALKTLTQITNLNEFLTILLDYHWFNKLTLLMERLADLTQIQENNKKNVQNYENLASSPLKNYDQNRQHLLNHCKKLQLTTSTKKSKVILNLLIEDLIESLQRFDEIKPKTKRIKILIEQLYVEFNPNENGQPDSDKQIDVETIWRQLNSLNFQDLSYINRNTENAQFLNQLFEQISTIYNFMQVIRSTTHQIFNLIQHQSSEQMEIRSKDSSMIDSLMKKSNNLSEQRSLLTQMLKDSSQKSNLELNENQYSSQIVLKQRIKQHSQTDDLAFLDQHYRITTKQNQPYRKSQRLIKSDMSCAFEQGTKSSKFTIKRKEIKQKKSEMGCSQCTIF